MSSRPWKVVNVPTALGVCCGRRGFVLGEFSAKEVAEEFAYEEWNEERAVDKAEFYSIQTIKKDW